jgi:uncharacterized membrane protein YbhN (UPF0104 family)
VCELAHCRGAVAAAIAPQPVGRDKPHRGGDEFELGRLSYRQMPDLRDMIAMRVKSATAVNLSSQITRRVAGVALLSVAMASLLLAVPGLQGVGRQLAHLQAGWVVVALALELGSCIGFVVIFRLFFDELPAGAARELAWTEEASGALLPGGGVGALAIGGLLLRRAGVSTRRIVERSSALFFLTSAVNVAALVGAGTLVAVGAARGPDDLLRAGIPIIGGAGATAVVLAVPRVAPPRPQRRQPGWLLDLCAGIDQARAALIRPNWRLLGAVGYLAFDIAALGATFAATGRAIPVATLVLGYLIGYLANLIPVPGGFGVLEGGLAGTLIAYGAPAGQAAAAVIVYHAVALWMPSLGGLVGYALLRRRFDDDRPARNPHRYTEAPVLAHEPVNVCCTS